MQVGPALDDHDGEAWLRRYARPLNARSWRWPIIGPEYDMMSDALLWGDEMLFWAPAQVTWAIRVLWHYRTGLIIGESRPGKEIWELGRRLFPNWVGFHRLRCRLSRKYTAIYRTGNIGLIRSLKQIEEEDG